MKKLQRVAVDLVPMLPGGDNGGAKIFVLELLRELPKIAPGVTFVLLTRKSSDHELDDLMTPNMTRQIVWNDEGSLAVDFGGSSVRIVEALARRIPILRRFVPKLLALLKRLLAGSVKTSSVVSQTGADLLYCPFGGTVFTGVSIPMAVTVYDLQYRSYPQFFAPEDYATRDRNFRQACSMAAMAVISDYVRGSVIAQGLVNPERVFSIHIQIPKRLHTVDDARQRLVLEKFDLRKNEYFMYPANFWAHKNHKALIFAFEIALRTGLPADTKLVLTGAPSARTEEIMTDASSLDIAHLIVIPGFVDNSDFSALMMSSLGVIFPSLYEGFGMPVLEAMAMDCPVACSNVTSLPEVAGDAALLFDPQKPVEIAESMVRLATDDNLRRDLIARGHKRVDFFSNTNRMARQYWELFELAKDDYVHSPSVSGVYPDGWAGRQIVLRIPPAGAERTVNIELNLPEWVPYENAKLSVSSPDNPRVAQFKIARGDSRKFAIPIGSVARSIVVSIGPHFCPAQLSGASDTRELSVIVRKIELHSNDKTIVIFPLPA